MPKIAGQQFLDPSIIEKIKRMDVRARAVVDGFITGMHKSPYHGFAVEFATHREYVPGDEIKHIDWKVWSKTDRLYIKEYEEETNLKCTIILDCSKSMDYGQTGRDRRGPGKFDYAATIAASLAYLLQSQADQVGLVMFDTAIRKALPASSNPAHLKLILHELDQAKPDHKTDVGDVFHGLAEQIGKRGLVVLVSDLFVDTRTLQETMRHFRHRKHEMVVFHVMHDDEVTFPFQDNVLFKGLEIDMELLTEPRALRRTYLEAVDRFKSQVRRACSTSGIDYVPLSTTDSLDAALSSYLAFRQRAIRGARRR
ncbi:MAG: DUF58 domain-containing protein [Phycisphaeraceae bacterium]|nr:DUF58 domain-containing protein [Phycisphaeraceae bacterium]